MKRQTFLKLLILILTFLFFTGCGQEEQAPESKKEAPEYFYNFKEVDIYCYPDTEKILLDNHVEKREFTWAAGYPSYYENMENFQVGSCLNNSKKQLIFHPVIVTGTGVLFEELHIVDLESLEEYSVPDFVKEAEAMVDVETLVNTENEVDPEKIFIGAYQYYQVEGDKIYVNLNVSVQTLEELGTIRGVLEEKNGEICVSEWLYVSESK